jgi:hypothetical protein
MGAIFGVRCRARTHANSHTVEAHQLQKAKGLVHKHRRVSIKIYQACGIRRKKARWIWIRNGTRVLLCRRASSRRGVVDRGVGRNGSGDGIEPVDFLRKGLPWLRWVSMIAEDGHLLCCMRRN